MKIDPKTGQRVDPKDPKVEKARKAKAPEHLNIDEKNKKMKGRTPVIRERSNKKQIHL